MPLPIYENEFDAGNSMWGGGSEHDLILIDQYVDMEKSDTNC